MKLRDLINEIQIVGKMPNDNNELFIYLRKNKNLLIDALHRRYPQFMDDEADDAVFWNHLESGEVLQDTEGFPHIMSDIDGLAFVFTFGLEPTDLRGSEWYNPPTKMLEFPNLKVYFFVHSE